METFLEKFFLSIFIISAVFNLFCVFKILRWKFKKNEIAELIKGLNNKILQLEKDLEDLKNKEKIKTDDSSIKIVKPNNWDSIKNAFKTPSIKVDIADE